ncbi:unnamed protein product [Gulo gulo]|uniref:Uncharacterized protein n=1 Tax=Gulo gulo TaxID=48420 RepID=A0A9X9M978_GULGU|nr:unnamed protein product [Gulo gulo]
MRLPTLLDRRGTNLWPENYLELLKRSWGLPNLLAAMWKTNMLMT